MAAMQTPLSKSVTLLGQILLMNDLPPTVTSKVTQVIKHLGDPSKLFSTPFAENLAGMDEEGKQWFREFLAGAPGVEELSETETSSGGRGEEEEEGRGGREEEKGGEFGIASLGGWERGGGE